jgi:hypothetical protein
MVEVFDYVFISFALMCTYYTPYLICASRSDAVLNDKILSTSNVGRLLLLIAQNHSYRICEGTSTCDKISRVLSRDFDTRMAIWLLGNLNSTAGVLAL